MITYFIKDDTGLAVIPNYKKNCWVNVENPTSEEINILSGIFGIPEEFITDVQDIDERSRLEIEDKWLMMIIRIPVHQEKNGVPFITVPLGVLISDENIITICQHDNEVIPMFLRQSKIKKAAFNDQLELIFSIFLLSSTLYLRYLKQINIQTTKIESDLQQSTQNKDLHRLLNMEKCLVYFITSLKSNEIVIAKLKTSRYVKLNEDQEDLLEDVAIENKQALEMANIYSDIQSGMMDAFASLISNNLNVVMKRLTSITIILMIPTLIASYYGMNVPNYLEDNGFGFVGIIVASALLAFGGVFMFRRLKWF